jgi:hypothetical protein
MNTRRAGNGRYAPAFSSASSLSPAAPVGRGLRSPHSVLQRRGTLSHEGEVDHQSSSEQVFRGGWSEFLHPCHRSARHVRHEGHRGHFLQPPNGTSSRVSQATSHCMATVFSTVCRSWRSCRRRRRFRARRFGR